MRRAALVLAFAAAVSRVHAAGPLVVNGAGVALRWTVSPVPYHPDRGRLGALDNTAATAFIADRFAAWEAVPSAAIAFTDAGTLPVDVKASNYTSFIDACDGVSPIIFDDDGSITDDLLGIGARDVILGFASPDCGDTAAGTITEAVAVLNGRFVDGISTASNPEVSVADFGAVFLHEFGHFFNLDHSQVNLVEAFDGNPSNDDVIPTMFPFLVNGAEAASLALDDVASVSALYPAPSFATQTGSIHGRILRAGGAGFQGAYVVARAVGQPRHVAVGAASGARYIPDSPGGPPPEVLVGTYEIDGLPPGTYTIEVEPIDRRFTGGSSVGPLDPPVALPGVRELWNGVDEAATNPPDDPTVAQAIPVAAGAVVDAIDITLNEPMVANDVCADAVVVQGIPFTDTQPASVATAAADDPSQSCTTNGAGANVASLWYVFTAPDTGRFVIETAKSDYDTVLSAYSGACGALTEVACSDDTPITVQSRLDVDLAAGATIVVEVTAFHDVTPGTLRIAVRHGCVVGSGACDDGDACTTGDVCDDGICAGPSGTCDDGNVCTADACNGEGGVCAHDPITGTCDDDDVCTVADACVNGACTSGPRIAADVLAASLDLPLPIACGTERPRTRHALLARLGRAAKKVSNGAGASPRRRERAFHHARRLLRTLARTAARLQRRGSTICATALTSRLTTAQTQLDCVAADLGTPQA
jgi:hypothetical protein